MSKTSWELALQQSLDYPSLKCCATNTQLSAYLMLMYELFAEKHELRYLSYVFFEDGGHVPSVSLFSFHVHSHMHECEHILSA